MAVKKLKTTQAAPTANSRAKGRKDLVLATSDPAKQFDGLIHERNRLAIISALAVNRSMTFNDLKGAINLSDGNLSVHARKLEEAGYIDCRKAFENRMPRTDYKLSAKGRKALENYLRHMESLIATVKNA
jgi:DNA-binding HxlR family transcriptional regulator